MTAAARQAVGWGGVVLGGILVPFGIFWAKAMHDEVRLTRTELREELQLLRGKLDGILQFQADHNARMQHLAYRIDMIDKHKATP